MTKRMGRDEVINVAYVILNVIYLSDLNGKNILCKNRRLFADHRRNHKTVS